VVLRYAVSFVMCSVLRFVVESFETIVHLPAFEFVFEMCSVLRCAVSFETCSDPRFVVSFETIVRLSGSEFVRATDVEGYFCASGLVPRSL